jgi:tol-pal system protein YbgF
MKRTNGTWNLLASGLLIMVMGCSTTYAYLPGKPAPGQAPAPGEAPAPEAKAPLPPPDLAQQVAALEARVHRLEGRLAELEKPKTPPPAPARERVGKAAPARPAYPPPGDKAYEEGMRLYKGKKYALARGKFSRYLKHQSQGSKAAEAHYYLADSFYQEGRYKDAATEFNKVATQHPKSLLAPAALLRQAYSYQHLKQTLNYQTTLKKLVKTYPKSPEAKAAEKQLRESR